VRGGAAVALALVLAGSPAAAQDIAHIPATTPTNMGLIDRPHTIAEFEAGILTLPTAPISASQRGGATPFGTIGRGDATVQTGLHLLYRGGRDWAIGAGALFAPRPSTDDQYGGLASLKRSHARSYLWLGMEGRYLPYRTRFVETWVGLTVGGVIVADRFSTDVPPVPAIFGTSQVTVRTEGFSIGVQAGGQWMFAERWVMGLTLRADRWILPSAQGCTPIGDCSTLTGTVEAFEGGLMIGYRLPL
jgi:hypothetical protein